MTIPEPELIETPPASWDDGDLPEAVTDDPVPDVPVEEDQQ